MQTPSSYPKFEKEGEASEGPLCLPFSIQRTPQRHHLSKPQSWGHIIIIQPQEKSGRLEVNGKFRGWGKVINTSYRKSFFRIFNQARVFFFFNEMLKETFGEAVTLPCIMCCCTPRSVWSGSPLCNLLYFAFSDKQYSEDDDFIL